MWNQRYVSWMWADACALLDKAARLQHQAFGLAADPRQTAWEPPADVFVTGCLTQIVIALPGVADDSIDVRLFENGIVVEASCEFAVTHEAARIHRMELPRGRFVKHLALTPAHYRIVDRQWARGCLTLWLRSESPS